MLITDQDEIEDLFWGEVYEEVTDEEVVSTSRWSNYMEQIFKHKGTEKLYRANWEVGATEYQEVDLVVTLVEVEPYETTVTKYREIVGMTLKR